MEDAVGDNVILCPSARAESKDSVVFGAIAGTVTEPRVTYLTQTQSATEDLMAKAYPVTPTEIFRIAAPCASKNCQHFDGQDCQLATRIVDNLTVVSERLPNCSIRRDCRWWQQEGKEACMRCPQVVTDNCQVSDLVRKVATPVSPSHSI